MLLAVIIPVTFLPEKTESGFGNTSYNQRIGYNQSVNKKIGRFHPSEKILKRITLLKRFLIV